MASGVDITLRLYRGADAAETLAVFLAAVTETAAADYSPEQIAAWARPEERSTVDWDRGMRTRNSVVALIDERVVGFSDVSDDGYIDMMYVSPSFSRRGVAAALLSRVQEAARRLGAASLTANVSITAKPFFERHGFAVVREHHPVVGGVVMTNYRMVRHFGGEGGPQA